MADNWEKLKWRLQAVANNEAQGGCSGVALIFVNVFMSQGVPVGWYKPQRIPLEPRNFDVSLLPYRLRGNWEELVSSLPNGTTTGVVNQVLVVKESEPIGWLDTKIVEC